MVPLIAVPTPVVRLVAHLGLVSLVLVSAVVCSLTAAAAVLVVRHRRLTALNRRSDERTWLRRIALPVALLVAFAATFEGTYTLRALARDVHEDQEEVAAGLPVGPRVERNGPKRDAVVWAVGDGPDGSQAARAVGRMVAAAGPDRILYLGDVYGDYADYMTQTFGSAVDRVSPTPGNHEWPRSAAEYLKFWAAHDGPSSEYYSFTIAGWKVVSLNSEIPHGRGSAQLAWLRKELRPPGTCRIAFFHRPRYSAGRHGDQPDMDPVWRVLAGRATLVLAGHDHDIQRMQPRQGITELVVGSGGHSHYALHGYPRLAFGDDRHYGALRLHLRHGRAGYRFLAVDGTVLNSGHLTCIPL